MRVRAHVRSSKRKEMSIFALFNLPPPLPLSIPLLCAKLIAGHATFTKEAIHSCKGLTHFQGGPRCAKGSHATLTTPSHGGPE